MITWITNEQLKKHTGGGEREKNYQVLVSFFSPWGAKVNISRKKEKKGFVLNEQIRRASFVIQV